MNRFVQFDERIESPEELNTNELCQEVHDLRAKVAHLEDENEIMALLLQEVSEAEGSDELEEVLDKIYEFNNLINCMELGD